MKKNKMTLAAAVVVTAVFFGCQNPDSGSNSGGGLTLPAAVNPGKVQNFEGTAVADKDEALELLEAMGEIGFFEVLRDAKSTAFDAAFTAAYGKSFDDFYDELDGKTSYSVSIKIADSDELKDAANAVTAGSVTAATIKGTFKAAVSSSVPFGSSAVPVVGDTMSLSTSSDLTYDISGGFYTEEVSGTTYKIAGVITVQVEQGYQSAYKAEETAIADEKYTGDISATVKMTATLSISDGTKGGKFSASIARGQNQQLRTVGEKYEMFTSDVEVYDNTGKKIITLDSYFNGLPDIMPYVAMLLGI